VLLRPVLDDEDVDLYIRWLGGCLLGGNPAQWLILMSGKAETGKSTIAEITEMLVGDMNCTELRTEMLTKRFEIGRLPGKRLLTGKDVPGDFLMQEGARAIKKLVGHDWLTGEVKGSMDNPRIYGNFDMLITCNSRLRVILDEDVGAWRRRLLVIRFLKSRTNQRIRDFAKLLWAEEAEGILAIAVSGAVAYLNEMEKNGDFILSDAQSERVDELLAESDSLRFFCGHRIYRNEHGDRLRTEEIVEAYTSYCQSRGWTALGVKQCQWQLPAIIMELFGITLGDKIMRDDKRGRGYPHLSLKGFSDEAEPGH
jgi:phage/plasmid-associated DNA primase